jgi:ABC-type transport system substrate-binding protein
MFAPTVFAQQKYFFTIHFVDVLLYTEPIEYFIPALRQIGIDATVETVDFSVWASRVRGGTDTWEDGGWDATMYSIDLTPYMDMTQLFHSRSIAPTGFGNYASFNNGKADELMDEINSETNKTAAYDNFYELQKILYDEMPYLPIVETTLVVPYRDYVEGEGLGTWQYTGALDEISMARYATIPNRDTLVCATYAKAPDFMGVWGWSLADAFSSTLTNTNWETGEALPELAESWEYSTDGMSLTFHLRNNTVWSDGVPFNSTDVKFTFDAIMNPDTGASGYVFLKKYVESIEAPDAHTVIFHLKAKYPELPAKFGFYVGWHMVPEHTMKDIPLKDWRKSDYNSKPGLPSLGPYFVKEHVSGQYLLAERNDLWYGWGTEDMVQPLSKAMKYVRYETIIETATAVAALQVGSVDHLSMWHNLRPLYNQLTAMSGVKVYKCKYWGAESFWINTNHPILSNKWVRKAISYALPRQQYATDIRQGVPQVVTYPFPSSGRPWMDPALPLTHPTDVETAKAFMVKAGFNYESLTSASATPYYAYAIGIVAGIAVGAVVSVIILRLVRKPR